ncbi:hypothetical protein AAW50_00680 [Mycoplasmopsis canis]|uniref:DUF4116 domain-containing protein n=1 Tax=Mycoplasmopsis canis TaxID=29555 RepID=UPI0006247078|nr:DUF4116 domain-containing protein [Mycoplasmopsis canis]AKF40961.1 hypothetical protein AAW50_00680 [Mycoplasmopsis canis]
MNYNDVKKKIIEICKEQNISVEKKFLNYKNSTKTIFSILASKNFLFKENKLIDNYKLLPKDIMTDVEFIKKFIDFVNSGGTNKNYEYIPFIIKLFFEHIPNKLKSDNDFWLGLGNSIYILGWYFYAIENNEVFHNKDFVEKYLNNGGLSGVIFNEFSSKLFSNKDFILKHIKNNPNVFIGNIDESLYKDRNFVMNLMKFKRQFLSELPYNLRNDKEIVLEAIKHSPDAFKYASNELKNDKNLVLEAIKKWTNIGLFQYASDELKNDKKFVLEILKISFNEFLFVSNKLREDEEVILEGSIYSPNLKWVNSQKLMNKDFAFKIVKKNPDAIQYLPPEIKNDYEFLLKAAEINGLIVKNLPYKYRTNPKIISIAVKQNPKAIMFANSKLDDWLKLDFSDLE